ncbi:MAG: hypothetical protein R2724_09780 [Bryobacterales bacterium]
MKLARRIVPLAAALTLAALTLGASEVPREAGPLTFNTYNGHKASLAALKGKVVAVMFFSTDCPHCQHTAEVLADLQGIPPEGIRDPGSGGEPVGGGEHR